MSDAPRKLLRGQIAGFAPDPRAVRAFEQLLKQVIDLIPTDVETLYRLAQESSLDANSAMSAATMVSDALQRLAQDVSINVAEADNKAVQALDALSRIASSLELLAGAQPIARDNSVATDYIDLSTVAPVAADAVGRFKWNDTEGGPEVGLKGGNVTLQIGQENVIRVKNDDAVQLTDGMVVYVYGASGANMLVRRALADSDVTSASTIGIVTEPIDVNGQGFITTFGSVRGLNTNSFNEGDILYLSPTTAGAITNVKPVAPQHMVTLGFCTKKSSGSGEIFATVNNGYEIDELHNVLISSPVAGSVLVYDATTKVWKNTTLTPGTNVTITNADGSITISASGSPSFETLFLDDATPASWNGIVFRVSGKYRWILQRDTAETGANAGSDLYLYRYDDAGAYLGTVLTINRATGQVTITPTVTLNSLTASRVVVTDGSKNLASSAVTTTELGYLSGVTSAVQTQINGKEPTIAAGTAAQYWRGDKSWQTLNSTAVGLGNVTNDAQLKIASNLADLNNAATARSNLGLGTAATMAGPSGAIVGTTDTQTLTNKTLSTALVGNATAQVASSKMHVYNNSIGQWGLFAHGYDYAKATMLDANAGYVDFFYYGGSTSTYSGYIYANTTTTTYATSSDYRLKTDVKPMVNALDLVAKLNPVTFTWKANGAPGHGFIAHELQEHVPDAVVGEKDQMREVPVFDEEGKPIGTKQEPLYQGVDASVLVGVLTKAIQELKAEFDEYKAAHP